MTNEKKKSYISKILESKYTCDAFLDKVLEKVPDEIVLSFLDQRLVMKKNVNLNLFYYTLTGEKLPAFVNVCDVDVKMIYTDHGIFVQFDFIATQTGEWVGKVCQTISFPINEVKNRVSDFMDCIYE